VPNGHGCYDEIFFRLEMFKIDEPSAIYTNLPIIINNSKPVEKPGYYPSYRELDPIQKGNYLNWLTNPYNEIDIGYVFVFYYGLERHLLLGDFESAFETIIKLRNAHKNKSFLAYSLNAIILSSILSRSFFVKLHSSDYQTKTKD
jgi:hypothetical protein